MTTKNPDTDLAHHLGLFPPAIKPILSSVTSIQMILFFPANQSFIRERAAVRKEALEKAYSAMLDLPVEIVAVITEPERCSCGCKRSDC